MGALTERSADHRWVERWLATSQISFHSEYSIGNWSIDLYLPEWHLAIEVDGPWHSPTKDGARDDILRERFGVETLRINTDERGWKAAVGGLIIAHIEAHEATTQERLASWRQNL